MLCKPNDNITYIVLFTACTATRDKVSR